MHFISSAGMRTPGMVCSRHNYEFIFITFPRLVQLATKQTARRACAVPLSLVKAEVVDHGKANKSQLVDQPFSQLPICAFKTILRMPPGTILVPSGGAFTTAPFNLTSHQILHVDVNATLLGTLNISQIPVMGACLFDASAFWDIRRC